MRNLDQASVLSKTQNDYMSTDSSGDRLRHFIDVVVASLDDPDSVSPEAIARRAYLSRFHFDRVFKAAVLETPHGLRQRLLLERAGYVLARTDRPVTEIAFETGFASLEAFSRAFGRSPSQHRQLRASGHWLPALNGIHFHPPGGLLMTVRTEQRRTTMDLTDRLLEHDLWLTRKIIRAAARLDDTQLDRRLHEPYDPQPWEASESTVRAMIERLVKTREIWNAAIAGREYVEDSDLTLKGFERRTDENGEAFSRTVREIRDRGDWDTTIVDATCDPPQAFTFGGIVAHVVSFNAARRVGLISALGTFGIDDIGYGDPFEWERTVNGGEH